MSRSDSTPPSQPRPRPTAAGGRRGATGKQGGRRTVGIVVAVLALLVIGWVVASRITTTMQWFRSLGQGQVYLTRLLTGTGLFVGAFVLVGGFVAANMGLALRLGSKAGSGPESPVLAQYQQLVERRKGVAIGVPSVAAGLIAALSGADHTATALAWWHRTPFGTTDPYFGRDVSFYVFSYPWWHFVLGLALAGVGMALVGAFAVHLATGAVNHLLPSVLTPGGPARARRGHRPFLTDRAQTQLSVLVALGLVIVGLSALLSRYGLALSNTDLFTGVGYTDDHYRATAKIVVAVISFIVAVLFLVNAVWRHWVIPGVGIVLMLVSTIVVQGLYPALMQRFSVSPDAPDKERPYIVANIGATRKAFAIDGTTITDYAATTSVSPGQLKADAEALPSIRLMDPSVIGPTFEQLQQVRGFYSFPHLLDVDRYRVDGSRTDAVVAAREIDVRGIVDKSWNNLHTVYTHGFGLVAAYGSRRQPSGEPEWLAKDIPTTGKIVEKQSRIYYGEMSDQWVVVGSRPGAAPVELDTPGGGQAKGSEKMTTYDGRGGVDISNPVLRTMYATTMGDINLLLSDRVHSGSRILYDRKPLDRVSTVAPWLTVDSDALPAIVDGRLVWLVDGYTTSANYPNSTRVDLREAASDSTTPQRRAQAGTGINYIRNSVKAVVDAYDGTVTLYAWDEKDPVLATWREVFPNAVRPRSQMSKDLLAHVRYPQDLFKVQRQVLGRYHTTNPDTWYQRNDLWEAPDDPVRDGDGAEPPYYLTIRWPGDTTPVYSVTAVMVPNKRQNLAAYVAVSSDATKPDYGRLRILRMSGTTQIAGPNQTASAITADEKVSAKLLPYQNRGSASATHGNLLTLPMGGGLLYVQPIYAQRQTGSGSYPVLRFVAVRFGEHVGIGDTLQQALDQVFGGDAGAQTGEDTSTTEKPATSPSGPDAKDLLARAAKAFQAADKAMRAGDLATYQKQVEAARALVDQAAKEVR